MEEVLPMRSYKVECPNQHTAGTYKTAVPLQDVQVHCPHCGAVMRVSN